MFTFLSLTLLCCVQKTHAQAVIPETSYYYTDFSDGTLPAGWETTAPGYSAAVVEQAFELSISKTSSGDHYTLGNLFVKDFDLKPCMTIRYRSADTLRIGISLMGPDESVSQQEVFELPSSGEWAGYTFNLSALASESWGYDLESIQLVFQPGGYGRNVLCYRDRSPQLRHNRYHSGGGAPAFDRISTGNTGHLRQDFGI